MKMGIDAGNFNVKVATEDGVFHFLSTLGDAIERKETGDMGFKGFGKDEIVWEYNGVKGFAADLAKYESPFPRNMMGDSKAHEDAKLRTLLAVHMYGGDDTTHDIVVVQPYDKHTETEKEAIKDMLKGKHTLTINNVTKTFTIRKVEVAAEGAAAYFSVPSIKDVVRIVDIGSGTVNLITLDHSRLVNKGSDTMKTGVNAGKSADRAALAKAINAATSSLGWERDDIVLVCGGTATDMLDHVQERYTKANVLFPFISEDGEMTQAHPMYANAIGCYQLARRVFK